MAGTPQHDGHVHITFPAVRHRGAGTRRRHPEPTRTPWPAFIGGGTALAGAVVSADEFIAAGWTSSQIIGLLSAFVCLAGLLLAVWGKLLKLQDDLSRWMPRAVLDRNTVYRAAYAGALAAASGDKAPSRATMGHEIEYVTYEAARAASGAQSGSEDVAA